MSYKETFYFIAKSLTISLDEKNRKEIEKQLISESIDWNAIVKVSTEHYVLPALYCNLQRTNLLKHIPKDLVSYMKQITSLNRERNLKIILQVKELNKLLLMNNIKPIFLKGSANLIAGIYVDIAERMVGDIDFIFSKEDYPKAIAILKDNGYSEVKKYDYYLPHERHYERLRKDKCIAAVEIHYEILGAKKYRKEFDFNFAEKNYQLINGVRVLSYANKLNLSIISNYINDSGYIYKIIVLRNAYDVFVLSTKTNAKTAINNLEKLHHLLNYFLATCYEVFNRTTSLEHNINKHTDEYLINFKKQFTNMKATRRKHKWIKVYLFLKIRLNIIYNSIFYKEHRVWLIKRLMDKKWYKEKLVNLNFKKFT